MYQTVLIIDNDIEQTITYRNDDFGKFLNIGDYIELHKVRYKVCSKTCGLLSHPSKWILAIKKEK